MSQQKRERQRQGRIARLEAERVAADERRRKVRLRLGLVAFGVAVVAVAVVVTTTSGDDEAAGEEGSTTTEAGTEAEAEGPQAPVALPEPPAGETIGGKTPCPPRTGAEKRVAAFAQPPPTCIEARQALKAEITTSKGPFTVELDAEGAPVAVNNFVVLARYRFYDGLPFHRLVPGFVAQTGSSGEPSWGAGGPGYDLPDEKPTGTYAIGDVAMARSEKVSGSQFFVITGEQGATLTPDYPRLGTITEGLDVVQAISELGDPAQAADGSDGAPLDLVVVESIRVEAG